jgi:type VI secretion system protein ImpK
MNQSFARLVDPILRYMFVVQRRFVGAGVGHPTIDEVRDELLRLFAEARSSSASYESSRDYTELAEYALVYWVDEVLLTSEWAHADRWRGDRLLEWELYRENVAGDEFFAKAEAARVRSLDALEVFFLCVALGFQGRYAQDEGRRPRRRGGSPVHPQLEDWARETYPLVRENLKEFLPRQGADTADDLGPLPGRTLLLRVSVLTALTTLSTLTAWILIQHFVD